VNPVIERLAQQLVLHNPKQQQLQHFMIDALEGKSLSTKYPVNRDLTALKATVKVKSDPKAILPVETRKVLNNLILSIFKSRPTNVKQFILDSISDAGTLQQWIDFNPKPKPPSKPRPPAHPEKIEPQGKEEEDAIREALLLQPNRSRQSMKLPSECTSTEGDLQTKLMPLATHEDQVRSTESHAGTHVGAIEHGGKPIGSALDTQYEENTNPDQLEDYMDTFFTDEIVATSKDETKAVVSFLDNMYDDLMGLDSSGAGAVC
jgi:hypothetical protein